MEDQETIQATVQLIEAVQGTEGREWDVILLAVGLSGNGNLYTPAAVKESVKLFEGAYAFTDHDTEAERRARPERSIKDKVGRFSRANYGTFQVQDRTVEGIQARFKVIAPWLRETLKESLEMGEPDFLGFSINADAQIKRVMHQGKLVNEVQKIIKVHSVDVVTDPAAGGRIVRLVASNGAKEFEMEREELDALMAARDTALLDKITALMPKPVEADTSVLDQIKELQESARKTSDLARITEALADVKISDLSKARLRKNFGEMVERRTFEDVELTAAITEAQEYEAALAQQFGNPRGVGTSKVEVGAETHDRYDLAIQGLFAGEDLKLGDNTISRFKSLKEAYCRWTGRDAFDVDPFELQRAFATRYDSAIDHKRIRESLTLSGWGEIYADNLYIMMMKAYRADGVYNTWRKFVSDVEDVPDFQTRHWARVGGYADLGTVAEQATYPTLTTPTDEEVTYAIAKRGGIDDVTFEAVVGDRFGKIRQIPVAMGRSASRTLYKFVLNLITTDNAAMDYDSVTLYHSDHGNTGTTALSLNGIDVVTRAMRDQTAYNESSEILGARNKPKHLIVPNELEMRAQRIVNPSGGYSIYMLDDTSAAGSGATGIDPESYKGKFDVHVYDQLTDATDWWMVADPTEVATIVMGFLGGKQEPELFVQDNTTVGNVFTADKISYKVRHIFGGDVLDHRSFYRMVAS